MNNTLLGVLLGVLAYSLILTVVTLYKDKSSYFTVDDIDVITAGPFAWVLVGICGLIRFIIEKTGYKREQKSKEYKPLSAEKLNKLVDKVLKVYKKNRNLKRYGYEYFDLSSYSVYYENDFVGINRLLVKKPVYERLNKKFGGVYSKQTAEITAILKQKMSPLTVERMKADDCDEWFIKTCTPKLAEYKYYYVP